MIRLRDTHHQNTAALLASAIGIAEYYGFVPMDEALRSSAQSGRDAAALALRTAAAHPRGATHASRASSAIALPGAHLSRTSTLRAGARRAGGQKAEADIIFARREERALASVARRAALAMRVGRIPGQTGEANLFWRTVSTSGAMPNVSLELHVVGTPSAIAEALLLVVASAIAEEAGLKERLLSINNIGSPESSNRFVRDVGTYLRKHIESISPTLRPRAASDPLGALVQLIERGHPAIPRAPQAMEYLTEEERRRFWELLEYLEVFGLPYELTPTILGSRDCWSHALYELSSIDEESDSRIPFAFGGRYDPLASRFGGTVPAATIAISCEVRGKTNFKRDALGIPSIYFAHLGLEARRKSLAVLETLRHAEIPVYQSLTFEKIGDQMLRAREVGTPYIIIMGYKEATEGTVLVREVATNSQEAVPIPELPSYLKRHRAFNSRSSVSA